MTPNQQQYIVLRNLSGADFLKASLEATALRLHNKFFQLTGQRYAGVVKPNSNLTGQDGALETIAVNTFTLMLKNYGIEFETLYEPQIMELRLTSRLVTEIEDRVAPHYDLTQSIRGYTV